MMLHVNIICLSRISYHPTLGASRAQYEKKVFLASVENLNQHLHHSFAWLNMYTGDYNHLSSIPFSFSS